MNILLHKRVTQNAFALRKKFERKWIPFERSNAPAWVTFSKQKLDDKPDVYLQRADMFTITVKASEITASEGFGMGLTLRFPRVRRIIEKEEEEEEAARSAI